MSSNPPDTTALQTHDDSGRDDLRAIAVLEEPNRRRLYELVAAAHADIGRDQAADRLGMSRELAAFHLDRLVDAGLLEVSYRRLSGRTGPGAGRPAKLYRRASRELSVSLPPRRYAAVADLFADGLTAIGEAVGPEAVADALAEPARRRGRAAGTEARVAAGARPSHERLVTALRALLDESGYEPEFDGSGAVTLRNCPYRATSDAHRDLTCSANHAWAEGVADGLRDGQVGVAFTPGAEGCCVRFVVD